MRHLRVPRWWYQPLGVIVAIALILATGCHGPYPQSTLEPRGDFASSVDSVFMKTVYLAGIVFVLVEGVLLYAVFKFRGKPDDPDPHQIHGSTVVEIVWTIIPAVVLAIVAVPTIQAIFATAKIPVASTDGQPPLKIEVIGHQWWWEFRYPELGITTANELHVPVNRAIDFRLRAYDVVHSFWVPQFSGKRDLFPNRETRLWMIARVTGEFPSACAEFCGTEHGRMDFYLMSDSPEDFTAWVNRRHADSLMTFMGTMKSPAADTVALAAMDPTAAKGRQLFMTKGCMGCHSLSSMNPLKGQIGPNLGGIGDRKMIAAGWLPNTEANLKRWLMHFDEVKPGVNMKLAAPLTEAEADALLAYLRTQR